MMGELAVSDWDEMVADQPGFCPLYLLKDHLINA
jgi:hypothetical protein